MLKEFYKHTSSLEQERCNTFSPGEKELLPWMSAHGIYNLGEGKDSYNSRGKTSKLKAADNETEA